MFVMERGPEVFVLCLQCVPRRAADSHPNPITLHAILCQCLMCLNAAAPAASPHLALTHYCGEEERLWASKLRATKGAKGEDGRVCENDAIHADL